jgi:hypothetical protein
MGQYKFCNVSEESTASILDPEDGGRTFLRNVEELLGDYTVSHPTT